MALTAAEHAAEESFTLDDIAQPAEQHPAPAIDLFNAEMFLRSKIMDLQNEMPFLPTPEDVSGKSFHLPSSLHNFLAWVLVGDIGDQEQAMSLDHVKLTSDTDCRHVLSIGQDLIHCVTHGHVKTPKHVALPIALKQMTGALKQ